jgi:hypothetical protein
MLNAWKYRKVAYYVVAALIFVALTTGIVTQEQLDGIVNTATITSGYLGTFALVFAGTKTHRGSDDKATKDDVLDAVQQAGSTGALAHELRGMVEDLAQRFPQTEQAEAEATGMVDSGNEPGIYPGA